jgi:predicted porin
MKKLCTSLVIAGLVGFGSNVRAQSSVTLFGLIDAGFGYTNTNAGSRYAMMNGNINGDRWGLRGREDLGGGLAAIFQIESGFNVGTGALGQGGREFGRQAWVGLSSETFGTAKFGRQYDAIVDMVQAQTFEGVFGSVATTPGDVDNNDNSARISNVLKYVSPIYGGLQVEGMYALNGVAGSTGAGNTYALAGAYATGPFAIAAGFMHSANAPVQAAKRISWSSTTDSVFDGIVNNGYQTASSLNIAHVAGSYKIGDFKIGGGYSYSAYNHDAQSLFQNQQHFNSGKIYGLYQITPAFLTGLGYIYTRASGDTEATYHTSTPTEHSALRVAQRPML